jgi:hypothetical protein
VAGACDVYRHRADREAVPQWLVWCTAEIRRQPLTALTFAAATGFILGGGLRSQIGRRIVSFVGMALARGAMAQMASELLQQYGGENVGTSSRTQAGAF